MERGLHFRTNAPRVISESFEQEVVIVNLDTGRYYCLQRAGVDLWQAIAAGATVGDILAHFEARYDAPAPDIDAAVVAVIEDLIREELIVVADGPASEASRLPAVPAATRAVFDAPALQTYTDMQDLLLLDPIHEVDEAGWPVPAPPAGKDRSTDAQ